MSEIADILQTQTGWLSDHEIDSVRSRVPVVYVNAIPVRVDSQGVVCHVGLLLAPMPDGSISRTIVSGRVLYGERIRDALLRHLEKDLGTAANPKLPVPPAPFTVAEYFPDPDESGFHDPRQHAISLAYVVPVEGECVPSQDALDLAWVTPAEAISHEVGAEMTAGHDRLVRRALGYAGVMP